jgi:anti-anti-sigma regulatory factor
MPAHEGYTITGGVLEVTASLDYAFSRDFERALKELAESGARELVVDLTSQTYVTSVYLGMLGAAGARATQAGKTLTVRIPRALARFFQVASLHRLVRLEVVE